MAKFERHFAGVQAEPQTLPRAPARQLADTGQTFEAQALAQVGRGLTDVAAVAFKWYEREGNSEYDTGRGFAKSLIGEFQRTSYANSTELDAGVKKLESDLAKIPADNNLKNKSGLRKYKAWLNLNKAGREKVSAEKRIRTIAQNNQAALFQNLSNVAKDYTDPAEARARINTLIQGALDDGSIKTANQALTMKRTFTNSWFNAHIWRQATATVRPDGEVDWSQAVDWFNQPENIEGLDEAIVEDLAGTARSQANAQKRRDEEKLKVTREQQRDEIYTMIETNDEDTVNTINNSELEAKEKAALKKLASNPDVALNYPEYDKVVDIIDGVARGTHTEEQADEAIKNGVGKHFNATTATSLRTKLSQNLKADSPTRRPALTRGMTAIEEVFDIQIKSQQFGPEDLEEESAFLLKKQRTKNDLEAYVLEKDRTDEDIEKKVKLLTTPAKEETVRNWFDWFIIGTGGRGFRRKRPETFKHIATNPDTGERMGSSDGITWQKIP